MTDDDEDLFKLDLEMCPNCPYIPTPPWWRSETSTGPLAFFVFLAGLLMGAGILLLFLKEVTS